MTALEVMFTESLGPPVMGEPIAGRSEPREAADHAFRHDLRLYGLASGEIRVVCAPCDWARVFEPGHAPYDFVRLEMQHATGRFA